MKTKGSEALDTFKTLEDRIGRLLAAMERARGENQTLSTRLHEAREKIQLLESEIRDLRKERKVVRSRVQDMIRDLSLLEQERYKAGKETQIV